MPARKSVSDETESRPNKPSRVPMGAYQAKLEVLNKDPNFFYYWHHNRGDNLQRALEAGYEFVHRGGRERVKGQEAHEYSDIGVVDKSDTRFAIHGGVGDYGREFKLYLMKMPMEFRKEDDEMRHQRTMDIEESINRQEFDGSAVVNKYGNVSIHSSDQE